MRNTVTISLPQGLRQNLDQISKEEGLSRSDIIRESLRDYLFIRRFRSLRQKMIQQTQDQEKFFTDEKIFELVS